MSRGIVEADRATLVERATQLSRRVAVEHVGTRLSLVRFRARLFLCLFGALYLATEKRNSVTW